ncbi:MAG: hypothetical protein GY820_40080 [Gammaproteobacteria bacterium]|nr:hypothetical protein [Gammaproteobacteria bacterium]
MFNVEQEFDLLIDQITEKISGETNPESIKEIFNVLGLDSLESNNNEIQKFIDELKTTSKNIRPLLESIKEGLLKNEPLKAVITQLFEEGLLDINNVNDEFIREITISMHMMVILEALTRRFHEH